MKAFVDECVDWRLSRDITGHDVKTARQMKWSTIKNGELLVLADLKPLIPELLARIPSAKKGAVEYVGV